MGASQAGGGEWVNRHIRGFVWAVPTRSASVRTDVKDVVTRAAVAQGGVGPLRDSYEQDAEHGLPRFPFHGYTPPSLM
jgi:hypothetical protein